MGHHRAVSPSAGQCDVASVQEGGMHHAGDLRRDHHRHRAIRPRAGEPPDASRLARRRRRTQAVRRDLRQHRLHPDQDARRQRPGGPCRPPRGRLRRRARWPSPGRHAAGQGAQRRRRAALERGRRGLAAWHGELHGLYGSRSVRGAAIGARRRRAPRGRQDLHQCRRARRDPADPGARRRPLSDQLEHDGRRLPARAPDHPGRQLYRARVRADVSAVRQRGHGDRADAAPDRPGGRGRLNDDPADPRGGGRADPDRRRVSPLRAARRQDRRAAHRRW